MDDDGVDYAMGISIHAPRAGARLRHGGQHPAQDLDFNPRAPCGGATGGGDRGQPPAGISIHAPRAGARREAFWPELTPQPFQSTRPVRGRDGIAATVATPTTIFQSTRPVRGRDAT